jgi:5,10-methylenetetrahydrofolate reductase
MSKLREALEAGHFVLVAELQPPKGIDLDGMLAPVQALNGKVAAFSVPDNEHARMKLSPLAAGRTVRDAGGEPLVHLTCRDRNRLALESDLLGLAALGMENVLVVSGDYVTLGDHPQAKPVYDADSVQLLQVARGLMAGRDSAGEPLSGAPSYYLGAVVIPEAEPLAPQIIKFEKKVAAGARFFITPPVFDLEKLRRLRQLLAAHPVKLLASVKVLSAEEVSQAGTEQWRKVYSVPPELQQELQSLAGEELAHEAAAAAGRLLKQIKAEKLADGVHIKAGGRGDLLAQVLEAAGV